jgi:hypothetical protein
MAEGIRINDAVLEISPAGISALVNKRGAEVSVSKVDLTVSPEGLNALLAGAVPEGEVPPTATLGDGRMQVSAQKGRQNLSLDLQMGRIRLEITSSGLRLVSE